MGSKDWPDSRDQLLKDIESFSVNDLPQSDEPVPPTRFTPAAALVKPAPAAAVSAAASTVQMAARAAPSADPVAPSSNLLASLKQQAKAKLEGEQHSTTQQVQLLQLTSVTLERAFQYLNDFSRQLNILKPPYEKGYSFYGVADFEGMHWEEGRADYRMLQVSTEERCYDQVTMRYRLLGDKNFSLTRDNPAQEKLRKALFDHGITFKADEELNERARVERATFHFPCEIKAGLLIAAHPQNGGLLLRTRNIERFGTMEFHMPHAALDTAALDELALLILGKPSRIAQLFHRIA